MPMYYDAWDRAKEYYGSWKQEFYEIIKRFEEVYQIRFWDFTEHEIAKQRICWYDTEHLNYYGAIKFTEIVDKMITSEIN